MINHARTLLLNEPPAPDDVMEEFIEPGFLTIPLNSGLAAVHNLLIRPGWPRDYRNFSATILVSILHDSPYQKLIDLVDSRKTIDFTSLRWGSLVRSVTLTRRLNASSLQVVGDFEPDIHGGVFSNTWKINHSGGNTLLISSARSAGTSTITPSFSGDATGVYPLDSRSGIGVQVIGETSVPDGLSAEVSATFPMFYDIALAMDRLWSSDAAGSIFTTGKHPSLPELGEVFNSSSRPDQSLAAIIAAYVLSL